MVYISLIIPHWLYRDSMRFAREWISVDKMESEYQMPGSGEFLVTPDIRKDYEKNGCAIFNKLAKQDL